MKFKLPKLDKLLNDKNVLYIVFVLSILNILGYLLLQNFEAVVFFLIIGFLTTYFSKNMIIVLMVAMVSTSLFTATKTTYNSVKEAMSGNRREENKDTIKSKIQEKIQEKKQEIKKDENDEENDLTVVSKGKDRVDLASTLNEAYGNLEKKIGKGGIQGLTQQTSGLLDQQKQLMENIETMQPFIKTAESFMKNLDFSGLDNIGGMLSSFGKEKKTDIQ